MMSEKQYRVACGGVKEQIKMAQKLHCPHMEAKYKAALKKLQKRYLKPDRIDAWSLNGRSWSNTYYHI